MHSYFICIIQYKLLWQSIYLSCAVCLALFILFLITSLRRFLLQYTSQNTAWSKPFLLFCDLHRIRCALRLLPHCLLILAIPLTPTILTHSRWHDAIKLIGGTLLAKLIFPFLSNYVTCAHCYCRGSMPQTSYL